VASKPSPVANLADLVPGLSVSDVSRLISEEWGAAAGPEMIHPEEFRSEKVFSKAFERLVSDGWIWEKTPPFTERFAELDGLDGVDGVQVEIAVNGGRISAIEFTGSRSVDLHSSAERIIGCSYQGPQILESAGSPPPEWIKIISSVVDGDGTGGISLL
jgi:hypothetical protein